MKVEELVKRTLKYYNSLPKELRTDISIFINKEKDYEDIKKILLDNGFTEDQTYPIILRNNELFGIKIFAPEIMQQKARIHKNKEEEDGEK